MPQQNAAPSKAAAPTPPPIDSRRFLVAMFLLAPVLWAVVYVAGFKIVDRDFWAHVKIGEFVVSHHSLPQIEPFAYTRPGQPFKASHEWLSQVVLYTALHWFGHTGVIVLRTLLTAITAALVLLAGRHRIWSSAIIAVLALNALRPGLMDRPQLFSYAIFSAIVFLALEWLARPQEQTRLRIPMLILILHVLWVNLHGAAALLSFLVIGAMGADYLLGRLRTGAGQPHQHRMKTWWKPVDPTLRILACLFAALAGGLFVSPSGYHTLTYLHQLLTDKTIAFIGEWKPREFEVYLREMGPLWIVTSIALLSARSRVLFSLLVVGATAYASRLAYRHEMLFVVAAGVVSSHHCSTSPVWKRLGNWIESRPRRALLLGLAAFLCLGMYTRKEQGRFLLRDNLFGYGAFELARGAYEFVEREHITGRMFNTYGIGGYLIYRGYPERKVYIDGRNVDYGFDFMMQTYRAGQDPAAWKEIEQRFHLTYAFIDYDAIMDASRIPYSEHLDTNPEWPLVYLDDWVALYLKRLPENKGVIEKYSYNRLRPSHLRESSRLPREKEELEELKKELTRAIADSPVSIKARLALARLALDSGDTDHAARLMEEAQVVQPNRAAVFEVLAACHLHRGDYKAAASAYDKMLSCVGDAYPNLNYAAVASVYRKAGRMWRARLLDPFGKSEPSFQAVNQGDIPALPGLPPTSATPNVAGMEGLLEHLRQAPQKAQTLNDEGVDMAQAGKISEANEKFLAALTLMPEFPEALNNAAACYDKLGDLHKAEEFYRRAIDQKEDYPDARRNLAYLLFRLKNYSESLAQAKEAEKLGVDMKALIKAVAAVYPK